MSLRLWIRWRWQCFREGHSWDYELDPVTLRPRARLCLRCGLWESDETDRGFYG